MMQTENLSRPGAEPQDGDKIKITHDSGSTETKYFWADVATPEPSRKEVIRTRLVEIDRESTKPRTMRELQLNKAATKTWLQTLDDEAGLLRAELQSMEVSNPEKVAGGK